MWQKVLLANSAAARRRAAGRDDTRLGEDDTPQEKAAKKKKLDERNLDEKMEDRIKFCLSLVERLVFTGCIVALVILGERNLWSKEMRTGVEPITSIGTYGVNPSLWISFD